ncbi:hypothetical protein Hrubri_3972 [Herbaspirillum rubrisubalbicans M1]|uniref:T6SS phospholipase effector Tle1-like catalytic domain-containing protein n=1 Tax=Herbaspirillum rubrisubalbicans TaxID=80842 RepID=UPI00073AC25E|nr:DUF2235 domain-containing protein [Herbaspirillum rubrisubalbicans]ALU91122.1 hypothetical protein Hrubri_3972 [Herbaspirillum rubrisubalbicans M1]
MNSSSNSAKKGDRVAPPLLQSSQMLCKAAELADRNTAALDTPSKSVAGPGANLVNSMKAVAGGSAPASCRQKLWISIFFDGTGNNMDADVPTNEHSNVVRLYRAAWEDAPAVGRYRIYVPGIGTYFKEIGDNGGSMTGLGMGAMGQARLGWAAKTLEDRIAPHLARAANPSNAIDEINVAVFGFSRGATEARAFIRDFIKQKCSQSGNSLKLKNGGWPVRIRFMGLFDTVASVGLPMSANNAAFVRNDRLTVGNVLRRSMQAIPATLRAVDLAFGEPGADPSPGTADGHSAWADDLRIPAAVELCVHFIAAHEIRNSFPVDSVFYKGQRPANCREMIYPGVHSDVGGGYRPGEEGKSGLAKSRKSGPSQSSLMISQFPLRGMYDQALAAGVPLRPQSAWKPETKEDFDLDPDLMQLLKHYLDTAGWGGIPMGLLINKHMSLYFAWRFAKIRRQRGGDKSELQRISGNESVFEQESQGLSSEVERLRDQYYEANGNVSRAQQNYQNSLMSGYGSRTPDPQSKQYLDQLNAAQKVRDAAKDAYLSKKAQLDTMPSIGKLSKNMAELDAQLVSDAEDIRKACVADPAKRAKLRPHYKVLLEAYENEFIRKQGLRDELIFDFFEHHVHESLADFYQDMTLPSDPRVIYFGGDEKYKYAVNLPRPDENAAQAA